MKSTTVTDMTETKSVCAVDPIDALECLGHTRKIVTEYLCDDDIALALAVLPDYAEPRARALHVRAYTSNKLVAHAMLSGAGCVTGVAELMKVFACRECGRGCRFMARGLCVDCDECRSWTICDGCGQGTDGRYVIVLMGSHIRLCTVCAPTSKWEMCQFSRDQLQFGKCLRETPPLYLVHAELQCGKKIAVHVCHWHGDRKFIENINVLIEQDMADIDKCLKCRIV